jgi:mannose-6-phosphate isomerase-like protein (cupin superfamily)
MQVISGAGTFSPAADGTTTHWAEQLRVADLSVGTYSIARGGLDGQVPHTEDEIYVVTAGRARLRAGGVSAEVGAGSVIYVPAAEVHSFTDITEDFAAIVVFAPAEGSRASAS